MGSSTYKIVDLFSGLGGLSLGMEQPECLNGLGNLQYENLGFKGKTFKTVMALDSNKDALETFSTHFQEAEAISEDIQKIESFSKWNHAELVVGGPPCQGFSNLNSTKTKDLNDDRNGLWREFMRAVEDIQPSVFLIENVPRFLDSKEARDAVQHAEDLGYTTVVDRLWAHEYGVPQKRHRAFIIGSKLGTPFTPAPTNEPIRTVEEAIGDLPQNQTTKTGTTPGISLRKQSGGWSTSLREGTGLTSPETCSPSVGLVTTMVAMTFSAD
ncbi:DNA cytosine methyltransferase [Halobacteriaceae archaeon GCM10025711]